jgi:triosephosphate isomerase
VTPLFSIVPKNYLYGQKLLDFALIADEIAEKYNIPLIFAPPLLQLKEVASLTKHLQIYAPHVDSIGVGRYLAATLAEAVVDAKAVGTLLNHAEKPLDDYQLETTMKRCHEVKLKTMVYVASTKEALKVANLKPTIIVIEPTDVIGTGKTGDIALAKETLVAVKDFDDSIIVAYGGGISNGDDVYEVIKAGFDLTGSSSALALSTNKKLLLEEMVNSLLTAFKERN